MRRRLLSAALALLAAAGCGSDSDDPASTNPKDAPVNTDTPANGQGEETPAPREGKRDDAGE